MFYTAVLPNGRKIYSTAPKMPVVRPDLDLASEAKTASRGLDKVEYTGRTRIMSAEEKRYYFTDALPPIARGWLGNIIKEVRAKQETAMAISMAKMRQEMVESGELKPFVGKGKGRRWCRTFPRCPIAGRLEELCPSLIKWGL